MCGRLACGLSPEEICNSCCYKNSGDNHYVVPQWKDAWNSGKKYKPSYNICPNDVAPVLLSGSHFNLNSRLVSPMVFGVIPGWKTTKKYKTINCRIERIKTSKMYGILLKRGQRCVVICNGFYEWDKKKPFFFFEEQADGIMVDNPNTWNLKFTPENGCSGFKPVKLAALFNQNSSDVGETTLSFTIITKEASSKASQIHSREPAILKTEEQLDAWLDYEGVEAELALTYISHGGSLLFHPVSSAVNKTNNKEISCIEEKKESVKNEEASANFLESWLRSGEKRKGGPVTEKTDEKVQKTED